jgi:hypothetical protein
MHREGRGRRWAPLVVLALVLLVATVVGGVAYNAGVSHGLAIGAQTVNVEQGGRAAVPAPVPAPAPVYGYPGYYYGWHPWGFGFGFGFLAPVFFILFWFFVLRLLFWRVGCGRGRYWRHRRWDYDHERRERTAHF